MHAALPEKYYLAHAQELFNFVGQQCDLLLDDKQRQYLTRYQGLSEDGQCLLVRLLSRKPRFIKLESIQYTEIGDLEAALDELIELNFASYVEPHDWAEFLPTLTKPLLLGCLHNTQMSVKPTTAKQQLVKLATDCCSAAQNHALRQQFVVRRQQASVDYILFLFFGDLRNRLQKFAMRDLGVLKTRKTKATLRARFDSRPEARSAFKLQKLGHNYKLKPTELREQTADYLLNTQPHGPAADEISDTLLFQLGAAYSGEDTELAIKLWQRSNEPKATERWIRERYQYGDRDQLKTQLESLRDQELVAPTKVFIEDFYARKYLGKRTSIYTDMLREAPRQLQIDEVFVNQVEEGVIQHYRRQGVQAYFVENKHWRLLFALTFWSLLFEEKQQYGSEFDRLPLSLRNGTFYSQFKAEIELSLAQLNNPQDSIKRFTHLATRFYGYPTGLFRWSANLLDAIRPCLELSPPDSLAKVLRRMAINFRHAKDGYPDLMVVEAGTLRFEEIKAPGDVLRPNQLVSINRLRQAGLSVELTQIEWATDPNQCYAVVDIETTGGRQSGNAITEVAVVKVLDGEIIGEWSSLVNPQRRIPTYITHLTGIDNAMVSSAPLFADIADELDAQLEGCIFVAHNVGFDYGFIKAAYTALNRPFQRPKFCTVRNARKAFPGLKSYSLGNLCEHFDIDLDNHHRALDDAKATATLLSLIQETTSRVPEFAARAN